MNRIVGLALLSLVLAASAARADGPVSGNWRVNLPSPAGTSEQTIWIIKLETKDGKTTATAVAATATYKEPSVGECTVVGDKVRLVLNFKVGTNNIPQSFKIEGRILDKEGKKIGGVLDSGPSAVPCYLVPTDLAAIQPDDQMRKLGSEEMEKASKLLGASNSLRLKAQQAKVKEDRDALLKQASDADKAYLAEAPKLYRETLEKMPGTWPSARAGFYLVNNKAIEATPEELKKWAQAAMAPAGDFGPRYQADLAGQLSTALVARKQGALAVEYARIAEKLLDEKAPADAQAKVLLLLAKAYGEANMVDELKQINERVTRLEKLLDAEYLAKAPPFKVEPFAGRKSPSKRVVLMELFTGAECPPCVAADMGFDGLLKAFKATDLVLLQYHVHIPGPDPLTNADNEARWKYYRDAFAADVRGAPTSIFNGTPKASGGGAMAGSEKKYLQYKEIVEPLLETATDIKLNATAKRVGDKIQIAADVAGVANPGKNLKLRLALVETTIRYVGGNKVRFHHQVVRTMPGGPDGVAIEKATLSTKNEVDLGQLRKTLTSYLDDYAATKRPFPRADRPMDLTGLRLVAFVQDDATHEVLQAIQVEVTE